LQEFVNILWRLDSIEHATIEDFSSELAEISAAKLMYNQTIMPINSIQHNKSKENFLNRSYS
jgi:hypothetical protein